MNAINSVSQEVLKKSGFVFRKGAWYSLSTDFIHVLYFQRSLYSSVYYLELAVDFNPEHWVLFPSEYEYPKYYTLGARTRVNDKNEVLNLSVLTPEKKVQICSFVKDALRLFSAFTTLDVFKRDYLINRDPTNKYVYNEFYLNGLFLKSLQI